MRGPLDARLDFRGEVALVIYRLCRLVGGSVIRDAIAIRAIRPQCADDFTPGPVAGEIRRRELVAHEMGGCGRRVIRRLAHFFERAAVDVIEGQEPRTEHRVLVRVLSFRKHRIRGACDSLQVGLLRGVSFGELAAFFMALIASRVCGVPICPNP